MRIWLLAIVLVLCACHQRGDLQPGCPQAAGWHVGSIINSSGAYLMLAGITALVAGLLAFGSSFFTAFIPDRIRGICIFVAEIGACCIAIGAALVWIGNNPWVLGVAIALVAAALGLRYRRVIARWLGVPARRAPAIVLASSHPVTVKDPE